MFPTCVKKPEPGSGECRTISYYRTYFKREAYEDAQICRLIFFPLILSMATKKQFRFFNRIAFGFCVFVAILIGIFVLQKSVKNSACANTLSCKESLVLDVENDLPGVFSGKEVTPPKVDLLAEASQKNVLAETSGSGEKHIYVDLTTQTLSAYEGDTLFMQASVSTGKWFPTPTGEFTIWEKIRATKMSGGQGADYYYLPNVPYVMFFEGSGIAAGRGFSLHGAYWHNNFGHPMSHGCVNMRTIDAEKLYHWVNPPTVGNVTLSGADNPGTKITIYGETPR